MEVTSWAELQYLLQKSFYGNQWVFRGQKNGTWTLQTKLERVCRDFDAGRHSEAEQHLLHQFQRRLHHYRADVPALDDTLEWFALMQHHGAPTRLLDWTRSPYVAVYFAIEECVPAVPSCVYVLNLQSLHNRALGVIDGLFEAVMETSTRAVGDKSVFNRFVMASTELSVLAVEPFRMNERMAVQQGLFLVPTSAKHSFLENLDGSYPSTQSFGKLAAINLRLDAASRLNCLEQLRKMNIHRGSLFPGIDGFSQSLSTEIEIWGGFGTNRILIEGNYNEYF